MQNNDFFYFSVLLKEQQKYTNANFSKPPSSTEPTTLTTGTLNFESNSLNAEILWCLNMVNQHLSYNSCSHVRELFSAMFPESKVVAQKFLMGKIKSRYMIIYGLASYFKKELLKKINSSLFYSVSFDESFNSELQKCQMDINVRYWDTAGYCCYSVLWFSVPKCFKFTGIITRINQTNTRWKISSISNGWP